MERRARRRREQTVRESRRGRRARLAVRVEFLPLVDDEQQPPAIRPLPEHGVDQVWHTNARRTRLTGVFRSQIVGQVANRPQPRYAFAGCGFAVDRCEQTAGEAAPRFGPRTQGEYRPSTLAPQRRQQSGLHERRLAAAGSAEHGDECATLDRGEQFSCVALATEKEALVFLAERLQATIRRVAGFAAAALRVELAHQRGKFGLAACVSGVLVGSDGQQQGQRVPPPDAAQREQPAYAVDRKHIGRAALRDRVKNRALRLEERQRQQPATPLFVEQRLQQRRRPFQELHRFPLRRETLALRTLLRRRRESYARRAAFQWTRVARDQNDSGQRFWMGEKHTNRKPRLSSRWPGSAW